MCASIPDALHDRFIALLPKIELHGQIFFRHLKPHKKEEVLQEMRALAWRWFVRLAERGKDAADFISTFNSFLARAIRSGRRIMGQEKARDAMCELAPFDPAKCQQVAKSTFCRFSCFFPLRCTAIAFIGVVSCMFCR